MSTEKIKNWRGGKFIYRGRLYISQAAWKRILELAEKAERDPVYIISKAVEKFYAEEVKGGHPDE